MDIQNSATGSTVSQTDRQIETARDSQRQLETHIPHLRVDGDDDDDDGCDSQASRRVTNRCQMTHPPPTSPREQSNFIFAKLLINFL